MDRKEAINVLKAIQGRISELCPKGIALAESEANAGYSLELIGLCEECKRQTIEISDEQGLSTKQDKDKLNIFTPTQ
jgi:hypothetical protein